MSKYKLREYYHLDKENDIEYYGFSQDDVKEMMSDIETYVYEIENCIFKNEIGMALKFLEELKEKI